MYVPFALMVIVPLLLGVLNLAAAYLLRVRVPYRVGQVRIVIRVMTLWFVTSLCWLLSALPFVYGLAMGRAGAQLPADYEGTGDVLFKNGLGNLWWLLLLLMLDIGVAFLLRRDTNRPEC
jgi:hypothetical protein